MCIIRRFTDCESCTRPICTNLGSIEACEYRLTRETCFAAHRLEVFAVAGLVWMSWCVLGGTDFSVFFFLDLFSFQRTRPTASMKTPCLIYLSFSTDCESCTRPISTNPGSIESGEYGLTRGTCSIACRLELPAVDEQLWISWCVLGGTDFSVIFFFVFFFFERTRPAASMRPPCLIYLSTSTGLRMGCHYSICRCVGVPMCNIFRFY